MLGHGSERHEGSLQRPRMLGGRQASRVKGHEHRSGLAGDKCGPNTKARFTERDGTQESVRHEQEQASEHQAGQCRTDQGKRWTLQNCRHQKDVTMTTNSAPVHGAPAPRILGDGPQLSLMTLRKHPYSQEVATTDKGRV